MSHGPTHTAALRWREAGSPDPYACAREIARRLDLADQRDGFDGAVAAELLSFGVGRDYAPHVLLLLFAYIEAHQKRDFAALERAQHALWEACPSPAEQNELVVFIKEANRLRQVALRRTAADINALASARVVVESVVAPAPRDGCDELESPLPVPPALSLLQSDHDAQPIVRTGPPLRALRSVRERVAV